MVVVCFISALSVKSGRDWTWEEGRKEATPADGLPDSRTKGKWVGRVTVVTHKVGWVLILIFYVDE